MNHSDEDLRSAWAATPRQAGPCPAASELTALATGELTEAERARLADHVVGCTRCAADWRILSETHRGLSPQSGGRLRWFGLAAAAAMIAVVSLLFLRAPAPRREALRGKIPGDEVAASPKAGSRLEAAPREFAWQPPAGAANQRFRLFEASGKRVWESEPLSDAKTTLPEAVAEALPNGTYFWTVEVETAAGAEKLGPFPFDLARR